MAKTNFFTRIYALVDTIPKGKVMTYGQIATVLESRFSAKVVGFAMSAAPTERNLPCHRVVNRKGEMSPGLIFGGAATQRERLRAEGVEFLQDGRINLTASLWYEAAEPDLPE